MQDGSQSVISIRIEAELDKVDSLAKKFDVLKTGAKDLDYQFRQGKIGADQLKTGLADLQERGEALNGTYKQMTDLNATLFQVNQRASVDFKSLAVSVQGTTDAVTTLATTQNERLIPSYHELRSAMREHRFYANQSLNALMALQTFSTTLIGSTDGETASTKKLKEELRGTIEVASGATFAAMMSPLAEWALPIGIAAGAVTFLAKSLGDVNEAAKQAVKEGLDEYDKWMKEHTPANIIESAAVISKLKAGNVEKISGLDIERQLTEQKTGLAQPESAEETELKRQNSLYQQWLDANKKGLELAQNQLWVYEQIDKVIGHTIEVPEGVVNGKEEAHLEKLAAAALQIKSLSAMPEAVKSESIKNQEDLVKVQREGKLIYIDGNLYPSAMVTYFDISNSAIGKLGPTGKVKVGADKSSTIENDFVSGKLDREQIRQQEESIRLWKEENQVANAALSSIGAGLESLVHSELDVTRKGVNALDTAWITLENTAINSILNIGLKLGEQAIINAAIGDSAQVAAIATATATGTAIAAAYAPAALAASIASFGAADVAASGGIASTTATLAASMASLKIFDDGGWINEPVYGVGTKTGKPYAIAKDGKPEYVSSNPQMQSLLKERYSGGNGSSPTVLNVNLGNKTIQRVIAYSNGQIRDLRMGYAQI